MEEPNKTQNMEEAQQFVRRSSLEQTKKLKKTIILIFAGMAVFVALYYGIISLAALLEKSAKEYNPSPTTIIFYEPDYTENIFEDKNYLELDRDIYYHDVKTGITYAIDQDDLSNSSDIVRFIAGLINNIICGEANEYNKRFSTEYYNSFDDPESVKKEAFTMQKLYNIKFSLISEELDEKTGITEYIVSLEYMIYKNNGTFRTDIGSDAFKTQYLRITDREGVLLIDGVAYASVGY